MRRLIFMFFLSLGLQLFLQISIYAQSQSKVELEEAIILIYGLNSIEEIDEELFERMESISKNPLKINELSRSKLLSCGLLTQYQVASFLDYTQRNGDVLSYSELAALDGFNVDFVSALRNFVSLDSSRLPGQSKWERNSIYNTLITRVFTKNNTYEFSPQYSYGFRYKTDINKKYFMRLGFVRSYDSKFHYPSTFTGTVAYQTKKLSIVLGDFNLRFGQGLALWNGMSLSGVSKVDSFIKKPTGLSLPSSFSSPTALIGVASELNIRNFTLIVFTSIPKLKAYVYKSTNTISHEDFFSGFNLSYFGPRYRLAFTQANTISSFDAAFCFYGIDLWGELAIDWRKLSPSAVLGATIPIGKMFRFATLIRYFSPNYNASYNGPIRTFSKSKDELALSLGLDFMYGRNHSANLSLDYAHRPSKYKTSPPLDASQFRVILVYDWKINSSFQISMRGSSKLKFKVYENSSKSLSIVQYSKPLTIAPRNELRCDFDWDGSRFGTKIRVHGLWSKDFAILGYFEGKYNIKTFTCYLRQGIFKVDNWDDRIYVYERDLPGSFSVPAYYDRGAWTALYMKYSLKSFLHLGLRAAYTHYFQRKKPSRAELKFQLTFDF